MIYGKLKKRALVYSVNKIFGQCTIQKFNTNLDDDLLYEKKKKKIYI